MQLQAEKTAANAKETSEKAKYNLPSIDNTRPSPLAFVINGRQLKLTAETSALQ